MQKYFDIAAEWRKRCADLSTATLPGGHFFVDQFPGETARILTDFIGTA
jgi:haloacetate dehalogenase